MPKPEIRYTVGPEDLFLGDLLLKRADLDVDATEPAKSRNGWREVSEELAAQAVLPARVAEYGFEARNFTPAAPVQTSAPADAGTTTRTRNKAGTPGAQE